MKALKICVLGVGNWGINHVRTLKSIDVSVGCVEINLKRIGKLKQQFDNLVIHNSVEESLAYEYDGYIIATPASTHMKLSNFLISKRKPVLVEKPLCLSLAEANQIKSQIIKYNGKLIVGHLMLFHPAIQKIKSMISSGKIGNLQYIYSNRLNLGIVRKEENVFWSFAPHDVSLFQYFSESFPSSVVSLGRDYLQKKIHDTTITYLKYPNGIEGHIFVSWLHPFKEHRLVLVGSKGSLHFEDSKKNKPLLLYEKENLGNKDLSKLKNKTLKKIDYEPSLPLNNELKYFIDIIKGKQKINNANINQGIDVIKILEMATNSLNRNTNQL